jgi:hypothetical protein
MERQRNVAITENSMEIHQIISTKEPKICVGEKIASLTSGDRKTGHHLAEY